MISSSNYVKLKTNLRLSIQRLKMAEKKKTELAQKSRKEIAGYINLGKVERAKIRVEHIIREDYLVEAMEIVEMYCDLLLTRFGLIEQLKTLDEGLAEAISSILWVAPRLQADVTELKIVADLLAQKYGKQYAQAARENSLSTISEKLKSKLAIEAPPKILVEKYLIEITKSLNIPYEPDEAVLEEEKLKKEKAKNEASTSLIDFTYDPVLPPYLPVPQLPSRAPSSDIVRPIGFNLDKPMSKELESLNFNTEDNQQTNINNSPPPNYNTLAPSNDPKIQDLPSVPKSSPNIVLPTSSENSKEDDDEELDFEDLAQRFEALKKN